RGNIERHHAEVAEAGLDIAPLLVERRPAELRAQLVRLTAAVDRHAAVALPGGRVAEGHVVARRPEHPCGELVLLRLGFLDTHDVDVLGGEPVEKTLVCSRTDTVGVEADDAHGTPEKQTARQGYPTAPSGSHSPGLTVLA